MLRSPCEGRLTLARVYRVDKPVLGSVLRPHPAQCGVVLRVILRPTMTVPDLHDDGDCAVVLAGEHPLRVADLAERMMDFDLPGSSRKAGLAELWCSDLAEVRFVKTVSIFLMRPAKCVCGAVWSVVDVAVRLPRPVDVSSHNRRVGAQSTLRHLVAISFVLAYN